MAEEQVGLRREDLRDWAPWTRIFTAFKVALDPKKLLLAAAGILCMAAGWWLLSMLFFSFNSTPPNWGDYRDSEYYKDREEDAWKAYKGSLNRWNFLYGMAGPVPESRDKAIKYTVGDIAQSPEEFRQIERVQTEIANEVEKRLRRVQVVTREEDKTQHLKIGNNIIDLKKDGDISAQQVKDKLDGKVAQDLANAYDPSIDKEGGLTLGGLRLPIARKEQWEKFVTDLSKGKSLTDIESEIARGIRKDPEYAKKALDLLRLEYRYVYKPAGLLRTWPWFEFRGGNPLLLLYTGSNKHTESQSAEVSNAVPRNAFLTWLVEQPPVLLEPLFKFLTPVLALLHPSAGGWNRLYLLLILLWTLVVWAFFGGAITRMASVQVARHNEKVGMVDALRFTASRYRSYLAAQLLPLGFLAGLAILLFLYGLLEVITFFVGDIVIAGLGLPLALLFGLIMAVVLVGLVGWPLMFATISTEGSDSFDAISRSYSYVYQAPWSFVWYAFVAILYGAVLVLFIGVMGSLTVYLTKWGMTQTPSFGLNREPTYLFSAAPTSYGWRDLLLYQSQQAEPVEVVIPNGTLGRTWQLKESFRRELWPQNYIGIGLVSFWIYLLFLLVVGFGYSYFWTAASIIYLLMRRKVDDTEMDEIHLEEEELDMPYAPPTTPATAATPAGGATPLQMIEAPTLRTPTAPPPAANTAPASAPASLPPASVTPAPSAAPTHPAPAPLKPVVPPEPLEEEPAADGLTNNHAAESAAEPEPDHQREE